MLRTDNETMMERVAALTFVIFLFGAFLYSYYSEPNQFSEDLDVLSEGKFWAGVGYDHDNDGSVDEIIFSHPYPLLGILIFGYVAKEFFVWIGPFALVSAYLLLYFKVSKRIIYWYPVTVLNVLFLYTFTTRTFDWLLLPIVYDRLTKNKDTEAIVIGALMVYIHGFVPLAYLVILLTYMRRYRVLGAMFLLSLPQILPLLYFSKGYYSFWSGVLNSYKLTLYSYSLNFTITNFKFRTLLAASYIIPFIGLVEKEI
jgi:hypothetical protein